MLKSIALLSLFACCYAYPSQYYPYYMQNYDTVSVGGRNGYYPNTASMSRYYRPTYPRAAMSTFVYGERGEAATASGVRPPAAVCAACAEQALHQSHQPHYAPTEVAALPAGPLIEDEAETVNEIPVEPLPHPEILDSTEKNVPTPPEREELIPQKEDYVPKKEATSPEFPFDNPEEGKPAKQPQSDKRIGKKKVTKVEADSDDESDEAPPSFARVPYNAFFPVYIGGYPGGRSAGGAPGGATAIANAYSTGRGGVATSHATAYGRPESARQ